MKTAMTLVTFNIRDIVCLMVLADAAEYIFNTFLVHATVCDEYHLNMYTKINAEPLRIEAYLKQLQFVSIQILGLHKHNITT